MDYQNIIKIITCIINIFLVLYVFSLIYKDTLNGLTSVKPCEQLFVLIFIMILTMYSPLTAFLFTIAYIITLVSTYKNIDSEQNNSLRKMFKDVIKIPGKIFGNDETFTSNPKEFIDPYKSKKSETFTNPNKLEISNHIGMSCLDSSKLVNPLNVNASSSVIETNLLQKLASTKLDSNKNYINQLKPKDNTGFVI